MTTNVTEAIRILIVDDNEEMGSGLHTRLERDLSDLSPIIQRVTSFDEGEALLKKQGFDLAVLDVRLDSGDPDDEDAGRKVFQRVAKAQWLPVIFWTGVTELVEDLKSPPLVQVVNKSRAREVPALVRDALASGVPQFARQVATEVETATRGFLRDLVASQWALMAPTEKEDVLPLLANRLSFYLRNGFLDNLHLTGSTTSPYDHPSSARCYLMPPVTENLTTGDIFTRDGEWWVLVTPQCDMEVRGNGKMKAEYMRLARAVRLEHTTVGKAFIAAESEQSGGVSRRVQTILGDDNRFFYLPAYLKIPHLVIDFEQLASFDRHDLQPPATRASDSLQEEADGEVATSTASSWTRVATIDAPYSQALLYRLSRAVSRIGIEVIPPDAAIGTLTDLQTVATEARRAQAADALAAKRAAAAGSGAAKAADKAATAAELASDPE